VHIQKGYLDFLSDHCQLYIAYIYSPTLQPIIMQVVKEQAMKNHKEIHQEASPEAELY